jgi:hypothetical protein
MPFQSIHKQFAFQTVSALQTQEHKVLFVLQTKKNLYRRNFSIDRKSFTEENFLLNKKIFGIDFAFEEVT